MLTTLKGLPLSYNRDMQEDKEALFDALDTTSASLEVMTELVKQLSLNREVLRQAVSEEGLLATEVADYLVRKGVPFREAHAITGRLVRYCLDHGRQVRSLSLTEFAKFSPRFDHDVFECLTVESAIDRKGQIGGTAKKQVEARLFELERALG
jgi:argininosuccinate lyase